MRKKRREEKREKIKGGRGKEGRRKEKKETEVDGRLDTASRTRSPPPSLLAVENIGLNLCPVIALSLIPLRRTRLCDQSRASFKTAAEPTRRWLRAAGIASLEFDEGPG